MGRLSNPCPDRGGELHRYDGRHIDKLYLSALTQPAIRKEFW
jgi:hypothetical protein